MEVRRIVETPDDSTRTEIHWLPFLLPPCEEEPAVLAESGTFCPDSIPRSPSAELRRLLDETSDLLESPMASTVMAHMLAVGFELLIDGKLAPLAYVPKGATVQTVAAGPGTGDDSDAGVVHRITEVVEDNATAKFASVLAGLARQAHVIGNGSPNEYLSVSTFTKPIPEGQGILMANYVGCRQWRKVQNWRALVHWCILRISSLPRNRSRTRVRHRATNNCEKYLDLFKLVLGMQS